MSKEINPFEHAPLYEEEQVITVADLNHLWNGYYAAESEAVQNGDEPTAYNCCVSHKTVEQLYLWLKEGKPALLEEIDESEN